MMWNTHVKCYRHANTQERLHVSSLYIKTAKVAQDTIIMVAYVIAASNAKQRSSILRQYYVHPNNIAVMCI